MRHLVGEPGRRGGCPPTSDFGEIRAVHMMREVFSAEETIPHGVTTVASWSVHAKSA